MRVSAPGKLVLIGEYAVVEAGRAMVAAIDRRGTATLVDDPPEQTEFVVTMVEHAVRDGLAQAQSGFQIDTSAFYENESKLGVGSSGVVTLLTGALCVGHTEPTLLGLAIEAHRAASGGVGSGIDVAASYWGGVIATGRQPGPVESLTPSLGGLEIGVLYTGRSAKTPKMVAKARACDAWSRHHAALGALADRGIDAWRDADEERFLEVVRAYGRGMQALGKDADVPIVTDTIEAIMERADRVGAAAKPSGAGGGDVAIVFGPDPAAFNEIASASGATLVDMRIDPRGLVIDDD